VRSQQVYQALTHIPNRFALCRVTAVALKKLHKAHSRPEDTINDVLRDISRYKMRRSQVPHNLADAESTSAASAALAEESASERQDSQSSHPDLVFVGF
jgi:hypothetical protein